MRDASPHDNLMALTHDDVKKLLSIIDNAEHLEEVEVTWGDFQIHVWRGGGAGQARSGVPQTATAQTAPPSGTCATHERTTPDAGAAPAPAARTHELELAPDEIVIRAPMLGTFYRAASPGEPPFIEIGQAVAAGDIVCLIEVMKLFNSIRAGVDGTVTRILHENAKLVEFDEPLLVIRSASAQG